MSDFKQEALRELARRELERRHSAPKTFLQRAANDVDQNIIQPIENVGRTGRDLAAGFGQGIVNFPPNLYNLGAMAGNALGAHLPQSPTFNFAPDNAAAKTGEVASYFAAPTKIASKIAPQAVNALKGLAPNPKYLFTTKNSLKNELLNTHDALEARASDAFKDVSKQINKRGINQLPTKKHFDPEFFSDIKQYFPNTRASSELITRAKTGEYNALRKLQGDLYKRAKKNLGSDFEADNLRGAEMLEKREDINQAISNHLKKMGSHDLDKNLTSARNDWRTLQQNYYNDNLNNALIKMFNKDVRKIPSNLDSLLLEESVPVKNLLDFHPGLNEKVAAYNFTKNMLRRGAKIGIPLALGGLGVAEFRKH